jgi:hypothetical protein
MYGSLYLIFCSTQEHTLDILRMILLIIGVWGTYFRSGRAAAHYFNEKLILHG